MKIFNILPMLVLAIAATGFFIPVANAAADNKAPTVPTQLIAKAISDSQIDLSWKKSTDNTGVAGYKIYRGTGSDPAVEIISPNATTSYSDIGLVASTTYTYQVAAYDAANNTSTKSNTAITTTKDLPVSYTCPTPIPQAEAGCPQLNPISTICTNVKSPPPGLSQGAKGDGITDDTAVIQAHITALAGTNGRLYFEPGIYMIDAVTRLALRNNLTLDLTNGATLKAKPNSLQNFGVIIGKSVSKINIVGGTIQGERYQHKGNKGQWGFGIEFYNAHDVVIQGTVSKENWGDGLYIGATPEGFNSENISVCNFIADGNRRQGASITGANGVAIKQSIFKNTSGTLPEAGVDVEPNLGKSVDTVTIENSQFLSNRGSGIMTVAIMRTDPNVPSTGSETRNVTMRGNTITGNGANGWPAIFMSLAIGNTIDSNTILDNLGTGIYMEVQKANTLELNNQIINNNINFNPGNIVPPKYGLEMYQVNNNIVQCNIIKNTDTTKPNSIVVQFYNHLNNIITQNAIINGILNVFPPSGNTVAPNFTTLPEPPTCPALPTSFP